MYNRCVCVCMETFFIPIRDVDNYRGGRGMVIRHPPVNRGREERQDRGSEI